MKLLNKLMICAASCTLAWSAPAAAQDAWPMEDGDYVEVSSIRIDDGHALDYANHLAGMWRKGQDFAKAQGWITGYEVLYNVNPRENEPDVYLITRFARFADQAENRRRDAAYRAQMQAESGERAKYRHLAGSMLLREQRWKN
jgi:hypothetical protein